MTILIDPTVAASLAGTGNANNPLVVYRNAADNGTLSTTLGTERESAALAGTGTTYDSWVVTPTVSGLAQIQLVLPSAQSISFCAVAAHNLGTIGASIRVQYSLDGGSNWVDSGAGPETPEDNQAIAFYFSPVTTTHWRVRIAGAGSNNVEIAIAMFSNPITIEQRLYQGYAPPITPNIVDLQSNVSEGSNLLGAATVRRGSRASASLTDIRPAFLRSISWVEFQNHFNTGGGFFWAWRPTKYGDLFYAWRDGRVIAPENSGPAAFMSFEMGMRFYDQP